MKKLFSYFKSLNKFKLLIISFSLLLFLQTLILANIQILDGNGIYFYKEIPEEAFIDSKSVLIKGLVLNPGLYYLNQTQTLSDLITKAGGLAENTDLNYINSKYDLNQIPEAGAVYEIN